MTDGKASLNKDPNCSCFNISSRLTPIGRQDELFSFGSVGFVSAALLVLTLSRHIDSKVPSFGRCVFGESTSTQVFGAHSFGKKLGG